MTSAFWTLRISEREGVGCSYRQVSVQAALSVRAIAVSWLTCLVISSIAQTLGLPHLGSPSVWVQTDMRRWNGFGTQTNMPYRAVNIPPVLEQHLAARYRSLEETLCRLLVDVEARIRHTNPVHAKLQDRKSQLEVLGERYGPEQQQWT